MPIATGSGRRRREEFREIMANREHVMRLKSNFLDKNYFSEDALTHQTIVRPGLVLAQETNTKKYVPYHASALYGTGSDTAVGLLDVFQDVTTEDGQIAPVFHGKAIESLIYLWGDATLGTVPGAVKTALQMIEWV